MNTTYDIKNLNSVSIQTLHTTDTGLFATVINLARGTTTAIREVRTQLSAIADERRRQRIIRNHRRAQTIVETGQFRFDLHRDDIFARA